MTAFRRACIAGAAAALVVELLLLTSSGSFFAYEPLGDVFDAQAHSLLDGRWDVPPDVIKIEGFLVEGRTYTYFGPTPALLRLPVAALTDELDGRLTRLSLLLAWVTTLVFSARLGWRARGASGRDDDVGWREQLTVGLWIFTIGAGSSIAYLGSRPGVFHEAIGWGVAVALVGIDAVLRWHARRTPGRFAVVVLLATLGLLTRASVGAAPSAMLGLLLLGDAWRAVRARDGRTLKRSIALASALVVPIAAYAAVNVTKFDLLFTLPYENHLVSTVDHHRREVLAANGGTIQGLHFLPTTVLHYVRPDALGLDGAFPWIDFPRPAIVLGGVVMDQVDESSSVPASMPALSLVSAVGIATMVVDRRARAAGFGAAAAGSAICLVVTLAIGFVAQRYTADAVPFLVVTGALALPRLAQTSARLWAVAAAVLALAAVASVSITSALTIQFGQHYGFLTPARLRAQLASTQLDLPHRESSMQVLHAAVGLPARVAADRTFVIIGSCDGLYRSDGNVWQPVERTDRVGAHRLEVVLRDAPIDLPGNVSLEPAGDGHAVLRHADRVSRPFAIADRPFVLEVIADPLIGFIEVYRNDRLLLDDFMVAGDADVPLTDQPGVTARPIQTPVCDELSGRSS